MKKLFALFVLVALTQGAYASSARLQAFAQDDEFGALFFDDDRNMFRNPAVVRSLGNFAIMEFGANGDAASNQGTDADPKARGGATFNYGNLTYGAYLGNESDVRQLLFTASGMAVNPDRHLDLFVAGGSDLMWGFNVSYSDYSEERYDADTRDEEASTLSVRGGAMTDMWEGYAVVSLSTEGEDNNGSEFDGSLGLNIGGNYNMGMWTPYVNYRNFGWDAKFTAAGAEDEGSYQRIIVGAGFEREIKSGVNLIGSIEYDTLSVEYERASGATAEINNDNLPVMIGLEGKANEWLTLRGSIKQNLWGKHEGKNYSNLPVIGAGGASGTAVDNALTAAYGADGGEYSIANTTEVNAGATLTWGDFNIDGLIGTTSHDNTDTANNDDKNGILSMENLLTRVSLHYSW